MSLAQVWFGGGSSFWTGGGMREIVRCYVVTRVSGRVAMMAQRHYCTIMQRAS